MTAAETIEAPDLPFAVAPALPHIRLYQEEDAEEVARMWRESARAWNGEGPGGGTLSTGPRVRQDQRDMNTLATFIAWLPGPSDGRPRAVGYLSLFGVPTEADTAYVGVLSAHPDWHGQGVGRDLLKAALARTVALGYGRLDLHTWPGNMKAMPLYKKSGYVWVPDTSVKMENYLPQIFRLGPAQSYFRQADWYADFRRELTPKEDDEKRGGLGVYTYRWERDGRRLEVVIDRKAKSVIAVETERYAVETSIDDPKLPVGGERRVTWRVENRTARPLPVTILAEGEDAVRGAFQSSALLERAQEWSATVTAEQPASPVPPTRQGNRVRAAVVVDGEPIRLAVGTEVVQPVQVRFDRARWLTPGVARTVYVTASNALREPVRGHLRLAADDGLRVEADELAFELEEERARSWPIRLRAERAGSYRLRAQAAVRLAGRDDELTTKQFETTIAVAEPGAVFADWDDERAVLATDRLLVEARLQPGRWFTGLDLRDRETGRFLMAHDCAVGPPFWPSPVVAATWAPRVERDGDGITLVLAARPAALPGVTFERLIRLSPSGVVKVWYRATNTGAVERALQVNSSSRADLEGVGARQVAAPLADGLVVDQAVAWPDWADPELIAPERYAEGWMAAFGEGLVAATIWRETLRVKADGPTPALRLDLGAIPPGGRAESAPVYLYAGPGDWRTARRLWRQLAAPDAPPRDPRPRTAHRARLERVAFVGERAETRLRLDSERTRPLSGRVTVEVGGDRIEAGEVAELKVGQPIELPLSLALPAAPGALPLRITFDHDRWTDRYAGALLRVGDAGGAVALARERDGELELVRLDNGRLRLTVAPSQVGRLVELVARGANQLHASYPEPRLFVWFNPWYGGATPALFERGTEDWRTKLRGEAFAWRETRRRGQGVEWSGVTVSSEPKAGGLKGLRAEVDYLTAPGSNLVALVYRLENRGPARWEGTYGGDIWPAPGGDPQAVVLHYDRDGERNQKRVPGGMWGTSGPWLAVEAQDGSPVVAVVAGTPGLEVEVHDLGQEGVAVHPGARLDLAPGEVSEEVAYLVVAEDLAQARLYRVLSEAGELV
ncbi:MAG TPA: GNAT family N-acetyltransferase [Chloroflexota bacterium]|nr:GNAT family N-acetyltransferase [Chloroflexota bacterium]